MLFFPAQTFFDVIFHVLFAVLHINTNQSGWKTEAHTHTHTLCEICLAACHYPCAPTSIDCFACCFSWNSLANAKYTLSYCSLWGLSFYFLLFLLLWFNFAHTALTLECAGRCFVFFSILFPVVCHKHVHKSWDFDICARQVCEQSKCNFAIPIWIIFSWKSVLGEKKSSGVSGRTCINLWNFVFYFYFC